ncbi:MAG: hypothetical protein JO092_12035 [Candidatus Eremiobacteraeota bacterium]|nr:hypothetical protein [Candidatus Eremiobacteraeota bacterium]
MLTEPIALAERAEIPYYFVRARVRHELANYEGTASDWDLLPGIWNRAIVSAGWASQVTGVEAALPARATRPRSGTHDDIIGRDGGQTPARHDLGRQSAASGQGRTLLKGLQNRLFCGKLAHLGLVGWIDRLTALTGPHSEAVKVAGPGSSESDFDSSLKRLLGFSNGLNPRPSRERSCRARLRSA